MRADKIKNVPMTMPKTMNGDRLILYRSNNKGNSIYHPYDLNGEL